MEIKYSTVNEVMIAELQGNLDTVTSPDADASLNDVLDQGASHLLINFENVGFISSAGLRVLLGLAKRQMKTGGSLRVAAMNDTVSEVFKISGFDGIVQSSVTVDEALKAMV